MACRRGYNILKRSFIVPERPSIIFVIIFGLIHTRVSAVILHIVVSSVVEIHAIITIILNPTQLPSYICINFLLLVILVLRLLVVVRGQYCMQSIILPAEVRLVFEDILGPI